MGIPAGVRHVVLYGTLPGGEIWNSGFWINHHIPDEDNAVTQAEAMFTILKTNTSGHFWYEYRQHWLPGAASFDGVRNYGYTTGGPLANHVGQSTSGSVSGSAPAQLPNQAALCVTTQTSFAGARRRGRMFLPALGPLTGSNGLFDGTITAALLAGLWTDMKACATIGGETFSLIVVSTTGSDYKPMTGLKADLRPDIQRRRANRQARGTPVSVSG